MIKNGVIILVIFAILGGGAYFVLQQQGSQFSDSMTQNPSTSMDGNKNEQQVSESMDKGGVSNSGRYIPYESGILESINDKKRVLFFYANWCPTCRPADADFKENFMEIPEDVVVIRVNYNDSETDADEKTLAQKYGITYQHTYVQIDNAGNEVAKWNGGKIEELLTNIK